MKQFAVKGTYGSFQIPCTIYVCENSDGSKWYCAKGSANVNKTYNDIQDRQRTLLEVDGALKWVDSVPIDIELLEDVDCFTASKPIYTLTQLETAINS